MSDNFNDFAHRAILAIGERMGNPKRQYWEAEAGKVIFKHFRAAYHLNSLMQCYSSISAAKLDEIGRPNGCCFSSYLGPFGQLLFFHIDAFFEAEKSAHDFLLACLGSAGVLISPPNSLHDFYKKTNKGVNFSADPLEIVGILTSGWTTVGNLTKAYRDCFAHFISLCGLTWQTAINVKWINGTWKVNLYLPDNPESRSYERLKFNKNIDAYECCMNIFKNTERVLESAIKICLKKWKTSAEAISVDSFMLRGVKIGD